MSGPAVDPERHRALHPLARRALLHRLAHPPRGAQYSWTDVHQGLLLEARKAGAKEDELYHALATKQVQEVARELGERFMSTSPDWSAEEWFGELLAVTRAPLDEPNAEADALTLCERRAGPPPADAVVTPKLVVALQVHTDPLGDPGHDLCGVIHEELTWLRKKRVEGGDVLYRRANDYYECWRARHPRPGSHP